AGVSASHVASRFGGIDPSDGVCSPRGTHGKDLATSVAYCAFEAFGNPDDPEYRFWVDLFLKLSKKNHVGWA
ncbi:MAG: hypothetical protein E5W25_27725, partial [Mesorhizobium sp.]